MTTPTTLFISRYPGKNTGFGTTAGFGAHETAGTEVLQNIGNMRQLLSPAWHSKFASHGKVFLTTNDLTAAIQCVNVEWAFAAFAEGGVLCHADIVEASVDREFLTIVVQADHGVTNTYKLERDVSLDQPSEARPRITKGDWATLVYLRGKFRNSAELKCALLTSGNTELYHRHGMLENGPIVRYIALEITRELLRTRRNTVDELTDEEEELFVSVTKDNARIVQEWKDNGSPIHNDDSDIEEDSEVHTDIEEEIHAQEEDAQDAQDAQDEEDAQEYDMFDEKFVSLDLPWPASK